MLCPYTSPQNGKAECIIRSVNNVIRTLLIQASLPGHYWAEGLHTTTYMLNCLPTTTIQAACPHLALFGSVPSYEYLHVFGCTCYPNTTVTAPHKLSPRSTRCVFLDYSADNKVYCCLDLSTNRLIVSRHVVFDDDSFPLAASPNLTDLNFLCESVPGFSPLGPTSPLQVPLLRHPAGQHRRSLQALSPLWLPYPPRPFLQNFCPGRLPRLHHLPSQTAHHPVHGRPHWLPTFGGRWEPEPWGHVTPPELPCAGRRVLEPRRHVAPSKLH
jgi:hypothetical protein